MGERPIEYQCVDPTGVSDDDRYPWVMPQQAGAYVHDDASLWRVVNQSEAARGGDVVYGPITHVAYAAQELTPALWRHALPERVVVVKRRAPSQKTGTAARVPVGSAGAATAAAAAAAATTTDGSDSAVVEEEASAREWQGGPFVVDAYPLVAQLGVLESSSSSSGGEAGVAVAAARRCAVAFRTLWTTVDLNVNAPYPPPVVPNQQDPEQPELPPHHYQHHQQLQQQQAMMRLQARALQQQQHQAGGDVITVPVPTRLCCTLFASASASASASAPADRRYYPDPRGGVDVAEAELVARAGTGWFVMAGAGPASGGGGTASLFRVRVTVADPVHLLRAATDAPLPDDVLRLVVGYEPHVVACWLPNRPNSNVNSAGLPFGGPRRDALRRVLRNHTVEPAFDSPLCVVASPGGVVSSVAVPLRQLLDAFVCAAYQRVATVWRVDARTGALTSVAPVRCVVGEAPLHQLQQPYGWAQQGYGQQHAASPEPDRVTLGMVKAIHLPDGTALPLSLRGAIDHHPHDHAPAPRPTTPVMMRINDRYFVAVRPTTSIGLGPGTGTGTGSRGEGRAARGLVSPHTGYETTVWRANFERPIGWCVSSPQLVWMLEPTA